MAFPPGPVLGITCPSPGSNFAHAFRAEDAEWVERAQHLASLRPRLEAAASKLDVDTIAAYRDEWESFAHLLRVSSNHVYLKLAWKGFLWKSAGAFFRTTATRRKKRDTPTVASWKIDFESLMLAWLHAEVLFSKAFYAAPLGAAVARRDSMSREALVASEREACSLYAEAYVVLADAYLRFFRKDLAADLCVPEATEGVIRGVLCLCLAMAQRCNTIVTTDAIYTSSEEGPNRTTMQHVLMRRVAYAAEMLASAVVYVQESPHFGSPLQRICWTLKCATWAEMFWCIEPCLVDASVAVDVVNDPGESVLRLELAARSIHLALFYSECAGFYDPMVAVGNPKFTDAMEAETEDVNDEDCAHRTIRIMEFTRLQVPDSEQDRQKLTSRFTIRFFPHYVSANLAKVRIASPADVAMNDRLAMDCACTEAIRMAVERRGTVVY